MKRFLSISLPVLLLAAPALAQDGDTPEPWQLCNETSFILEVQTAAVNGDSLSDFANYRIKPGQCETSALLSDRDRIAFAQSAPAHLGGIRVWQGSLPICQSADGLSLPQGKTCANEAATLKTFMRFDISEPITHFIEPDEYGNRALTAGVQRLLIDNGYDIKKVDGMAGRRTSRTLSKYLKDNSLPTTTTNIEAIDLLEQSALTRETGLTVCNDSEKNIWLALGYKPEEHWVSKGWWSVAPNACTQPVRNHLKGQAVHLFARQSTDMNAEKDRFLSPKADSVSLCISETRFTAYGRDGCEASGYATAPFRPLSAEGTNLTVRFTNDDFSPQNISGLRK